MSNAKTASRDWYSRKAENYDRQIITCLITKNNIFYKGEKNYGNQEIYRSYD